jgi:hypothetical protein
MHHGPMRIVGTPKLTYLHITARGGLLSELNQIWFLDV